VSAVSKVRERNVEIFPLHVRFSIDMRGIVARLRPIEQGITSDVWTPTSHPRPPMEAAPPAELEVLMVACACARASRDFVQADVLRQELPELAWTASDAPDGQRVTPTEA